MKYKSTLVLAAAIALMTPGAAFANTHTTSDPLGDMSSVGSPVPTASMDITEFRTSYTSTRIKMRVQVAELNANEPYRVMVLALAPDGRAVVAYVMFDGYVQTTWMSEAYLPDGRIAAGDRLDCGDVDFAVNETNKTVTMWMPSQCLGTPRKIKAAALTRASVEGGDVSDSVDFSYDAPQFTGPWIKR
mgnify:FL=1